MRVLGFMTGTSLDAVDMAVLETDGEQILGFGPAGEKKLDPVVRRAVEQAITAGREWPGGAAAPPAFARAARMVAEEHLAAAAELFADHGLDAADLDLASVHGQTVLHAAPGHGRTVGRTVQLIETRLVAEGLGLPVAFDFRSADVAAGGQGAPLAPVYHRALVRWSKLQTPVAVLNLGGVGNVTLVDAEGAMTAFDTGPANGMIDLMVQDRTGMRCDEDGRLARAGRVDEAVLAGYLADPYFAARGPKSLDRFDFSLAPVASLSTTDAAATLTAFAARAVAWSFAAMATAPLRIIVCGGGRLNPCLMEAIQARTAMAVQAAECVGWRGDSIEAEAFAYLAARTLNELPISFPGTTGVPEPMCGGTLLWPTADGAGGNPLRDGHSRGLRGV